MIDTERYRIILENLNIASVVVNYTISFFLGYYFLQFFSDKKRTALIGTIIYHAVVITGGVIPYDLGIVARYLFIISSILGCFLAMYAVERIRLHQKMVLALVWYTIRGLAVLISSEIEAPISNFVFSNPNLNRIEWLVYEYVGVLVLEHGVFLLYTVFLIKLYQKGYGDPDYEPNTTDMLILSLPALSRMVSHKLYLESYESYEELFNSLVALDDTETLKRLTWSSYTRIFDVIVSSAFLIALVFLMQRSRKLMRKNADEEILSMQMADMRERIGRIEYLYRDMRSLKHDLKHEIRLLNELVSEGHIDDAKRGLDRLKEEMAESVCEYSTGHPVTDVLLSDYGREALSDGIEFECEFSYSPNSGIDVFDISMILSNAISNAIRASVDIDCPEIAVKGFPKQNMFLIVIKNTWRERMPAALLGYSRTLADVAKYEMNYNGIHGYGIPNMRRIAQKYFGDISYEKNEDAIVFTAMLQMDSGK